MSWGAGATQAGGAVAEGAGNGSNVLGGLTKLGGAAGAAKGGKAGGALSGAASGASMGSMAGPYGALAGAVIGGVLGAATSEDPHDPLMTAPAFTGAQPISNSMADSPVIPSGTGGFSSNPYQQAATPQPASTPPPVPSPAANPPAVTPPNPWLTGMAAAAPVMRSVMGNDRGAFAMQNAPSPNLGGGGKPIPVTVGEPVKRGPSPLERYMMTLRR